MKKTRCLLQNQYDSDTEEYALIHDDRNDATAVEWSMDDTQGKDNPPPKRFENAELSRVGNTRRMITDDMIQTMITELLVLGPSSTLALILHREASTGIDDQLWRQLGRQERINHGAAHEIRLRELSASDPILTEYSREDDDSFFPDAPKTPPSPTEDRLPRIVNRASGQ
jgi:hypothetical protein